MSTITKKQQQCTCHSYNQQKGETPNVVLDVPESIRIYTDGRATVCIDACIADAIKNLWSNGLPTLNSCCGHNKDYPEVVIPEGSSPVDYLNVLEDFDGRTWAVSRWERVKYTSDHSEKKHMASLEAEPVAYVSQSNLDALKRGHNDVFVKRTDDVARPVPLYTAPPVSVSVPECFKRLLHHAYGMTMGHDWNKGTMAGHHRTKLCQAVEECRAAMLQGADGALTNEGSIPSTQFKPVADLYGLTLPTGGETSFTFDAVEARDFIDGGWSCQEYVELERFQDAVIGNSPVIPDDWVACTELVPENDDFVYIWPRPDFGVELHVAQYGKFDKRDAGWYAQVYVQNYGIEYYPVRVTHWMPMPAAPQQEDNNG